MRVGSPVIGVTAVSEAYHTTTAPVGAVAVAVNVCAGSAKHSAWSVPLIGAVGNGFIVTTISDLGPSQLFPLIWLTQYEVLPIDEVSGVGAVEFPVPPVATVYHNKLFDTSGVAINATAVSFKQYSTRLDTPGEVGNGPTITVATLLFVGGQPNLVTLT